MQVRDLKKLIRPTTQAVIVNFPHNPSGALLSVADWEALVEQCRSAGAYLFSDEMYRSAICAHGPSLRALHGPLHHMSAKQASAR